MDLSAAGLSDTEAKVYQALLEQKDWKPSDLAKSVGETRTNMYKILDRLVELGLATRYDRDKKLHYRAANPLRLTELARIRRIAQQQNELELETHVRALQTSYLHQQEQPGVRFFHGKDGMTSMYEEQSHDCEPISFIASRAALSNFTFEELHALRMLAVKNKVPRQALVADSKTAPADWKLKDPLVYLERTWLAHEDYNAPVELGVYGDKVYIISFKTESMGMIIESPQIAEAFRQILNMLHTKQRQTPDYNNLPRLAKGTLKTN